MADMMDQQKQQPKPEAAPKAPAAPKGNSDHTPAAAKSGGQFTTKAPAPAKGNDIKPVSKMKTASANPPKGSKDIGSGMNSKLPKPGAQKTQNPFERKQKYTMPGFGGSEMADSWNRTMGSAKKVIDSAPKADERAAASKLFGMNLNKQAPKQYTDDEINSAIDESIKKVTKHSSDLYEGYPMKPNQEWDEDVWYGLPDDMRDLPGVDEKIKSKLEPYGPHPYYFQHGAKAIDRDGNEYDTTKNEFGDFVFTRDNNGQKIIINGDKYARDKYGMKNLAEHQLYKDIDEYMKNKRIKERQEREQASKMFGTDLSQENENIEVPTAVWLPSYDKYGNETEPERLDITSQDVLDYLTEPGSVIQLTDAEKEDILKNGLLPKRIADQYDLNDLENDEDFIEYIASKKAGGMPQQPDIWGER